jgi:hypothetical protein
VQPHYTSPPRNPRDFADFATWIVQRYAPAQREAVATGAADAA